MDSIQTLLTQACEDVGEEVNVRTDYSGRGYRGASCIGITGPAQKCHDVLAAVFQQITQNVFDATIDAESEEEMRAAHQANSDAADMIAKLMRYSQDNMGFSIILYWPSIEPEAEPEYTFELWKSQLVKVLRCPPARLDAAAAQLQQPLQELYDDECEVDDAADIFRQVLC